MKRLLLIALFVSGCAFRAQMSPPVLEGVLLYGRDTNCTAEDVPAPLAPDFVGPPAPVPQTVHDTPDGARHCSTLEVGAKSYTDTVGALGVAIAGILAKMALF